MKQSTAVLYLTLLPISFGCQARNSPVGDTAAETDTDTGSDSDTPGGPDTSDTAYESDSEPVDTGSDTPGGTDSPDTSNERDSDTVDTDSGTPGGTDSPDTSNESDSDTVDTGSDTLGGTDSPDTSDTSNERDSEPAATDGDTDTDSRITPLSDCNELRCESDQQWVSVRDPAAGTRLCGCVPKPSEGICANCDTCGEVLCAVYGADCAYFTLDAGLSCTVPAPGDPV